MPATGVWFRNDLRTTDHAPLLEAARRGPVTCVYCLDPREHGHTRQLGLPRLGPHRARFLIECLADLRRGLRELGGDLVIRRGPPEAVLPGMATELGWDLLLFHERVGTEERATEDRVWRALQATGCRMDARWDLTLLDPDDLPFAIDRTPEVFTSFRKQVEQLGGWRGPLPAPTRIDAGATRPDPGELPTQAELGCAEPTDDRRAVLRFVGGESAGRERVRLWMWERDRLRRYKETRDGMVGSDYSSKLSPWLAHGALSARMVQAEIERYEQSVVRNESTWWLTFELLWRDYFQLILAKHGAALFHAEGLQGIPVPWQHDRTAFAAWCEGRTGIPLVDASMRELDVSGFLSNRGRQIVASFLTKNLGIDWRWGAEWFEARLVDHDVASNYGNWNYAAGVGNDARGFRYFHVPTQAARYDRDGRHAALWFPELAKLPAAGIHAPWTLPASVRERAGLVLGVQYPEPVVDLDASVAQNREAWESAIAAGSGRRANRSNARPGVARRPRP